MKWPDHGGQPLQLQEMLQEKKRNLLDFSANINPLGPPDWVKEAAVEALDAMTVYPDPDYKTAAEAAAESENIPPQQVLITNGGAEAIYLAARLVTGGKVLLIEPSFKEYRLACAHYQITIDTVSYKNNHFPAADIAAKINEVDAVFICRPHNPTGTLSAKEEVEQLMHAAPDTYFFVDEAFIDFLPETEKLTSLLAENPKLVLLRSFTKMFAIPGLRSGCLLASEEIIQKLQSWQMPWSVNTISAALIPKMTADKKFVESTVAWLEEELHWIRSSLNTHRWSMSESRVNFYILRDKELDDHEPLLRFLMQEGIAVRHTYNFDGINGSAVRAAVRSRNENNQLLRALRRWEESH
ncbi:threonine-phosphate decarboxylase CobD [Alkalicoccus daliensis]|uniref:threonine-phosphate decarboxylase n=1 Tax=Alkalicoccus daliensis TaxID=745820 RepID=A0A1H0HZ21_9BACI|nr:threonine-phosphate decarboxylase CobD [Alkalicoccus daliensis]SDO24399.1 L-threonine O-3-phosphate decarboxylase [Alkalicoccus daliensis]